MPFVNLALITVVLVKMNVNIAALTLFKTRCIISITDDISREKAHSPKCNSHAEKQYLRETTFNQ